MKLCCLILICFAFSPVCEGDTKVVERQVTGAYSKFPQSSVTRTFYIQGRLARLDGLGSLQAGFRSAIFNPQEGTIYVVNPEENKFYREPVDLQHRQSYIKKGLQRAKTSVRKTGKSFILNQFPCEEYIITLAGPATVSSTECIAGADWNYETLSVFHELETPPFGLINLLLDAIRSSRIKGFPIRKRTIVDMAGAEITIDSEVLSVSHENLDPGLFRTRKNPETH